MKHILLLLSLISTVFTAYSQDASWVQVGHIYKTFNENNKAVEVKWDRITEESTFTRKTSNIKYDQKGKTIERITQRYNDELKMLVPFSKSLHDRANKTRIIQKWDARTGQYVNDTKRIRKDKQGYEIMNWDLSQQEWINHKRVTHTRHTTRQRSVDIWLESIGKWMPYSDLTRGKGFRETMRYDDKGDVEIRARWETHGDRSERITEVERLDAEKNIWNKKRKHTKEIDGDQHTTTFMVWDEELQDYRNKRRIISTKEGRRKTTQRIYQKWDKKNGEWSNKLRFDFAHNEANKVSNTEVFRWKGEELDEDIFLQEEDEVFSLETNKEELHFANPFVSGGMIQLKHLSDRQSYVLSIVDMKGAVVLSQVVEGQFAEINVNVDLFPGMHVVLLSSNEEIVLQKKMVVARRD